MSWFLLLLMGCYDASTFGGPPVDDDDATIALDDDDATANDDDSLDDDDSAPGLPTCVLHDEEAVVGDAGCFAVEPLETFEPNEEIEWQWASPAVEADFDQVITAPIVINLTDDNGDGAIDRQDTPDVLFYSMNNGQFTDGVTRALSGADGTELWTINDANTRARPRAHVAAANLLDLHPGPEIIIVTQSEELVCLTAAGAELWRASPGETLARAAPAIHDLDGDGEPEVIVGRFIYSNEGVLLGAGAHGHGGNNDRGMLTFAVDLDGDGDREVVAGNAAYAKDGSTEWSNDQLDGFPGVADFDLDGDPEVVVVSDGGVRLQDHVGAVLWGPVTIAGNGRGGPPTIADYDGDGLPEVGVANSGFYTVLDTDGSILWSRETDDESSGMTGSSVFDFNGDGAAEVVYADELNLWVYQGSDGQVLLQEEGHTSRTQLEYPVIADIDADDHAEIVLGSNDHFTEGWSGVTVLGTTVDRGGWWAARPIWNQHAFFFSHIDADGEVPANPVRPWLEHNSFRQNFPEGTWEGYPAADFVAAPDGPCQVDGAPYFATRADNVGAAAPVSVTSVAVYATTTSEQVFLGTASVGGYLDGGRRSATILVPFDPDLATGSYRVVADDDGTGGSITECDEVNNGVDWP